jgi:hypothetical protein
MVPPLQQGPRTRHMAWKIVGPRGHPRETLALPGPTTTITSEASPSAAPVVLTPPSNQVGPLGIGSPPDWLEKYVRQSGDPLAGPFCYPIPSRSCARSLGPDNPAIDSEREWRMRGISTEEEGRKRNGSTLKGRLEEDGPHCNKRQRRSTTPSHVTKSTRRRSNHQRRKREEAVSRSCNARSETVQGRPDQEALGPP